MEVLRPRAAARAEAAIWDGPPANLDSTFPCRYRGFILLLTFFIYTCYHMSRKPISVVKVRPAWRWGSRRRC